MEKLLFERKEKIGSAQKEVLDEVPLTWSIKRECPSEEMLTILERKLSRRSMYPAYQRFIMEFCILIEKYELQKFKETFIEIDVLIDKIQNEKDDKLLQPAKEAFHFLLNISKAQIAYELGFKEAARTIIGGLLLTELTPSNYAAIYGIKAGVYMQYDHEDYLSIIALIDKGKSIDPTNAHLSFLKGVCFGRRRRFERLGDVPSRDELKNLEECLKADDTYYTAHVADSFKDASEAIYRKFGRTDHWNVLKEKCEELNRTARDLYIKCVEQHRCNVFVMFRCARGLMKLPHPYKDVDLAEEILFEGLEVEPHNEYGNHTAAMYFMNYKKDNEKAKKHLQICADHNVCGAEMDLLRLEYVENKGKVNVVQRLQDMSMKYPGRKANIYTQMASYEILINNNLTKCLQHLKRVIELNPEIPKLHSSSLGIMKYNTSLYEIVANAIYLEKKKNLPEHVENIYDEFLDLLKENHLMPDVSPDNPSDMRQTVLRNFYNKPKQYGKMSTGRRAPKIDDVIAPFKNIRIATDSNSTDRPKRSGHKYYNTQRGSSVYSEGTRSYKKPGRDEQERKHYNRFGSRCTEDGSNMFGSTEDNRIYKGQVGERSERKYIDGENRRGKGNYTRRPELEKTESRYDNRYIDGNNRRDKGNYTRRPEIEKTESRYDNQSGRNEEGSSKEIRTNRRQPAAAQYGYYHDNKQEQHKSRPKQEPPKESRMSSRNSSVERSPQYMKGSGHKYHSAQKSSSVYSEPIRSYKKPGRDEQERKHYNRFGSRCTEDVSNMFRSTEDIRIYKGQVGEKSEHKYMDGENRRSKGNYTRRPETEKTENRYDNRSGRNEERNSKEIRTDRRQPAAVVPQYGYYHDNKQEQYKSRMKQESPKESRMSSRNSSVERRSPQYTKGSSYKTRSRYESQKKAEDECDTPIRSRDTSTSSISCISLHREKETDIIEEDTSVVDYW